jgi:predicted phage terminase large subunit-like protein
MLASLKSGVRTAQAELAALASACLTHDLPTRAPDPDKLSFVAYVTRVKPRYVWYPHALALAAVLQRVADGELSRVMVFEPPRHGKSEEVSRLFSAYFLYRYPERFAAICSYAAELAYTLSRSARENFKEIGGHTKSDADAVKHWETLEGGGLWAAGVGGPATGKGWHLGIIDDPVKNHEEAASETIQRRNIDWYDSTFYTREEPDGALILIQTRWHDDDLAGKLLARESEDEPENWHIVNFPALKEPNPKPGDEPQFPANCTIEPDRRKAGEPLCPARYPLAKLRKIARRIGEYFWSALYQQRPTPLGGLMFKREDWQMVAAAPVGTRWVRYWDKAGTEDGGAYSAGVLMGEYAGTYYVADVVRGQWSSKQRDDVIDQTARLDSLTYGRFGVEIRHEQEPGSGGKQSAEITNRRLAGYAVQSETVTGDKVTRARPLSSQVASRNVYIVATPGAAWVRPFLDEADSFPNGKYKDQIDAAAGGFNHLALTAGSSVIDGETVRAFTGAMG